MKRPPTRRAGGPITGNPGGPITLAKIRSQWSQAHGRRQAFTVISAARHSLHPHPHGRRPLTTPQASLHAADRIFAPPCRAFDAGLRPHPFPDEAASLLSGHLAATRTGLTPASDDELTNSKSPTKATPRSAGRTKDRG